MTITRQSIWTWSIEHIGTIVVLLVVLVGASLLVGPVAIEHVLLGIATHAIAEHLMR